MFFRIAERFNAFVDALLKLCHLLAMVAIVAIGALILTQAVARQIGYSVPGTIQTVGMLLAVAIALELAPTLATGGHIRVNLILEKLPPVWKRRLEIVSIVLGVVLLACLSFATFRNALESYSLGAVDSQGQIAIPLVLPHGALFFGVFALFLAFISIALRMLTEPNVADIFSSADQLDENRGSE